MNVDRKIVGKRLKHIRERKHLKQNYVAKKLGVHNSTLNKYESGEREPDLETLHKLAEIYEVSTDYLLGRTDYPQGIDLTNKSEEEKNKIYEQFVIEKADEPIKFRGKELTPEQLEYLNKALNIINELPPEKIKHIMKATDLAMEAFKIAEKEKKKEKGET